MMESPGEHRTDLYTLLARPAPGEATGQVFASTRDLAVMVAGWRARDWIEVHAEEQGIVFAGVPNAAPCKPCARYAVAVLRGQAEAEALQLACDQLREMRQRALAAVALVDKYTGRPVQA